MLVLLIELPMTYKKNYEINNANIQKTLDAERTRELTSSRWN